MNEEDWISKSLKKTKEKHKEIPDSVVNFTSDLMHEKISEKNLTAKELVTISEKLLLTMTNERGSGGESGNED